MTRVADTVEVSLAPQRGSAVVGTTASCTLKLRATHKKTLMAFDRSASDVQLMPISVDSHCSDLAKHRPTQEQDTTLACDKPNSESGSGQKHQKTNTYISHIYIYIFSCCANPATVPGSRNQRILKGFNRDCMGTLKVSNTLKTCSNE